MYISIQLLLWRNTTLDFIITDLEIIADVSQSHNIILVEGR